MQTITPAELAALDAATILDVREPDEFTAVHVPGAQLIPLGQIVARFSELPVDEPIYVICAVGGRSAKAAEFLGLQGYDVYNVVGGTNAWIEAGLPVEATAA